MKKRAPFLVAFLLVASAYMLAGFQFLEYRLMDLRFGLIFRPATGALVLVDIDPASLNEIGVWPWPRTDHAKVVRLVEAAGAKRIAADIDFSSRSTPTDDRALAEAFASANRKVILPVFRQFDTSSKEVGATIVTAPPAELADTAILAFSNIRPDADSLIRRIALDENWNGQILPTFPAAMAGLAEGEAGMFHIDYSIRPETVSRISYADVLNGRFDPAIFQDKVVLIGATAIELGDQLAVPLYRALPGPMVQALAFESIVQDRTIQRLAASPVLAATLLLAIFLGPPIARQTWRRGLVYLGGVWAIGLLGSLAMQAVWPVSVDVVPWLAVSGLSFLIGLFSRLDHQSLQVFLAGMAASHTRIVMRHMADNAADGIILIGPGGNIEMFNPAAERIFARHAAEVAGTPISTLLPQLSGDTPEDSGDTGQLPVPIGRAWVSGGVREILATRSDGTEFPMEIVVTATELRISHHPVERRTAHRGILMCIVRDVSERKQAEQRAREELERRVEERTVELRAAQEQLLRSERLATLGQLTATVSHELRNPLGTIRSTAFVVREILDHAGGERLTRALDRIERNVERCDRIIDELLEFTRDRPLAVQAVVVDDWLSEVLEGLSLPEGLHRRLDPGCAGEAVSFDPEALRRCVINLHENACHALNAKRQRAPDAELLLTIQTRLAPDRLELRVADTGIGIKPDILPRVFEPLFSTKGFGVGLGLVIVRKIMQRHAGGIEISSVEGEGTQVLLWLPRSAA
ncbi:CHASE2 domain-containing protein [Shumkonia mesophila]|uniref:CHASE2 domain-containing protein n=1 Tax=Shumkonia mesophila TaxID=2838854 RepID=UPI0029342807|nr:CHASE2 domain-containing protein [Shumkonia mesophila]